MCVRLQYNTTLSISNVLATYLRRLGSHMSRDGSDGGGFGGSGGGFNAEDEPKFVGFEK